MRHGLANPFDGHDTALHEFAHVLDLGDGAFDGTPALDSRAALHAWADVFSRHYAQLRARPERSRVLRAYGAAAITAGRLVLALECELAGGLCGATRAPTLSLVGVSPASCSREAAPSPAPALSPPMSACSAHGTGERRTVTSLLPLGPPRRMRGP